jgi:outer membrane protein OmpA-like peptidoglycan-associated protein
MKSLYLALWMLAGIVSYGKTLTPELPKNPLSTGYYIVVAAYRLGQEDLAERFKNEINQKGMHAEFGYDAKRQLYYVFLDRFVEFKESIQQMLSVRKETGFDRAWVRVIKDEFVTTENSTKENIASPVEVKETEDKTTVTNPTVSKTEEVKEKVKEEPVTLISTPSPEATEDVVADQPKPDPIILPHSLADTEVFLSLYNATNNRVVQGDVQVVDGDRNVLIKKVKGNDYLMVPDPKNNSGKLYLIADVFGYRKVQQEINYKEQIGQGSEKYKYMFGNFLVVNFDLVRYNKGDLVTLYNVYFYKDAAVMLPESKYELNTLLNMMEEKRYKIVLHGHTNGNSHGKIITMGASKDFFSINGEVKEGFGSAKQLSEERAHTIKNWLVSNGIEENRIEVKAWGGGRMLYDKHSANAKKNVRVEVEVVDEL